MTPSQTRNVLAEDRLHPSVRAGIAGFHAGVVQEVLSAAEANAVVVVGMAGNPWCRRARRTLDAAGVEHRYLEYGSYLGGWKQRLALKMWAGWPTFPMVLVRGQFIGGAQDVERLIASGELQRLLAA